MKISVDAGDWSDGPPTLSELRRVKVMELALSDPERAKRAEGESKGNGVVG